MKAAQIRTRAILFSPIFVLFLLAITWAITIPYNHAPDEETHFHYNVEFMVKNHRLPVSGVDDLDAYQICRENLSGRQACLNSYQMFPAFSYVLAAISSSFFSHVFKTNYLFGARLASIAWGMLFNIFSLLIAIQIIEYLPLACAAAFCVIGIPQVVFISTYVNQDIHSLAISAILGFALLFFAEKPSSNWRQFFLSCAFGAIFVCKYNYFIFAPVTLLAVILVALKNKLSVRQIVKISLKFILLSLLISGFWYVRNFYLYKDLLGLKFAFSMMDKFHAPGLSKAFDVEGLKYLWRSGFITLNVHSFFATFDYMNLTLRQGTYTAFFWIEMIGSSLVFFGWWKTRKAQNEASIAFIFFILIFLICGLQSAVNSLVVDFQPQGRYFFPILIPCLIFLSKLTKQKNILLISGVVTIALNNAWLLIASTNLLLRKY